MVCYFYSENKFPMDVEDYVDFDWRAICMKKIKTINVSLIIGQNLLIALQTKHSFSFVSFFFLLTAMCPTFSDAVEFCFLSKSGSSEWYVELGACQAIA